MKNKGGAPKKNEQLKLNKRLILSFNEPECTKLQEKGLLNSIAIKSIIMNSTSNKTIQIHTNKDPKYIFELNRIGNNLNQLAIKANSTDQFSDLDIRNFWTLLNELEKLLTE